MQRFCYSFACCQSTSVTPVSDILTPFAVTGKLMTCLLCQLFLQLSLLLLLHLFLVILRLPGVSVSGPAAHLTIAVNVIGVSVLLSVPTVVATVTTLTTTTALASTLFPVLFVLLEFLLLFQLTLLLQQVLMFQRCCYSSW